MPDVDWKRPYPFHEAVWVAETEDNGFAFLTSGKDYTYYSPQSVHPARLVKIDSAGDIQWIYNITLPFPESIITTSDGGFAYTGRNDSILIISKLDSNGNSQWNRTYESPLSGHSLIVQTGDNGFFIAAHNTTGRNGDIWIIDLVFLKADAQGVIQWTSSVNATGSSLNAMIRTSDGGYALAGSSAVLRDSLPVIHYGSKFALTDDFCLFKISPEGTLQWNKTYGGVNGEQATSLVQTSDGGYAIVGNTESFGAGSSDAFLVKTDASGNLEWAKTYGGYSRGEYLNSTSSTNGERADYANSIIQTSDGGLAFAGKSQSNPVNSFYFAWLVKTDFYGNMQWDRTFYYATYNFFGATDGINWGANSLIQAKDNSFVLAGYTSTDAFPKYFGCFIMKTNPATPIPTTASPPSPMLSLDLEPIIINADGSITPSDAPIIRENNQYEFTDNIHNPLVVEADNIIIDGQGHWVDGRGTINNLCIPKSQVGIDLFNVNNVKVEDIRVRNFKVGVFIDDSDSIRISQNKVTYNYYGIISYNSTNSIITDNEVTSNKECGIYLEYCLNDKVMNNQLLQNGLILYYSSGNIISNNGFNSGGLHPYYCENLLISGNSFYDRYDSIAISHTLNTTIAANSLPECTNPIVTNGVSSLVVFMNNFSNYTYAPIAEGTVYINGKLEVLTNTWDNGTVGNYWNDYMEKNPNATEVDGSGVWDTPYDIDGNNTDNHPLVAPVSADELQALSQVLISEHIPSTELTMVDSYSIEFQPSNIPEFLSWILIPLFLIGTGLGIGYRSRLRRNG